MPVSMTEKHTAAALPGRWSVQMRPQTLPRIVNLIALPTRLTRICRSRTGSVKPAWGTAASQVARSSSPFSAARIRINARTSSTMREGLHVVISTAIFPASIVDKSRMSLINCIKVCPFSRMMLANSLRSASLSRGSRSKSAKPRMAFIGVRISWLTLARNWLFATLARSAAALAACMASSVRLRAVMSAITSVSPSADG